MPNVHVRDDGVPDDQSDHELWGELAEVERSDALERVTLHLMPREELEERAPGECAYARELPGGLVEVLVLNTPDHVVVLRDADVDRLGLADLRAAGLENLLCLPIPEPHVIEWPFGVRVHELWDQSWRHTASKVLVLRDVLRSVFGTDEFAHGVLIGIPTDHELVLLPVVDCQVFGALPGLQGYVTEAYEADPARLAPDLLWWRAGELRTVARPDGGGIDPAFRAEMVAVAEEESLSAPYEEPAAGGELETAVGYATEFCGHRMRCVRRLFREALADEGIETVEYADRLETANGMTLGLHNLFARCRVEPPQRWQAVVSEHVRLTLAVDWPAELATLDRATALARVHLRLIDRNATERLGCVHTYARPVVGDLVELLVLDKNDTVMWLRDCDVAEFGLDDLRAAGRANLLRAGWQRERVVPLPHGARARVLEGGGHTASQVLVLPEVLRRVFGRAELPNGVLVAMPTKYELWLHPIVDRFVYPAYLGLADVAMRAAGQDPGALSPYVFWWRDGELVQILTEDEFGFLSPDLRFIRAAARTAEADDEAAALALLARIGRDTGRAGEMAEVHDPRPRRERRRRR